MPYTLHEDLVLAFPYNLLPPSATGTVPSGLYLRPLASSDHSRSHLDVLSGLTLAPDTGAPAWLARFEQIMAIRDTYYPIVLVEESTDQIVAMGTVFLERKFTRGLGVVGHIEDISVSEKMQGKGLGKKVIEVLTALSESLGSYKTILDCDPKNEAFYVKCGYANKGYEMAKYT